MSRVCLIVDHPQRDLDGLVHLGRELAGHGVEVFLVPMYHRNEVFLLRPDVVVVNYVRFSNAAFVRACKRLGMAVAVLDTEGGVRQDMAVYAQQAAPFLKDVDLYCTWGRRQAEALASTGVLAAGAIRVTGCPRFDFAAPGWQDAIAEPPIGERRYVLINTNFPILRPRFQSAEREVEDLVNGMGYDAGFIRRFIEQSQHVRTEMLAAVRALARAFPAIPFVLRPHPFESRQVYEEAIAAPNVWIIQEGTVLEWIRRSVVVLHHNCSTAIESFLMGREPLMPAWIEAPLLEQPLSASVSLRPPSLDALCTLVADAWRGAALPVPAEVQARRQEIIADYFCANDGRAADRACDAILDLLRRARPEPVRVGYRARVVGAQGSVRAAAQLAVTVTAGPGAARAVGRLMGRVREAPEKAFTVETANEVLQRLNAVQPSAITIITEPAGYRHKAFALPGSLQAVRVGSAA